MKNKNLILKLAINILLCFIINLLIDDRVQHVTVLIIDILFLFFVNLLWSFLMSRKGRK